MQESINTKYIYITNYVAHLKINRNQKSHVIKQFPCQFIYLIASTSIISEDGTRLLVWFFTPTMYLIFEPIWKMPLSKIISIIYKI